MRYMLDTNICIYLMKNEPPSVRLRFEQLGFGDVVMSAITLAELRKGQTDYATDPARVEASIDHLLTFVPVLVFDNEAAGRYGELHRTSPGRRRNPLDRLIAAHAIAAACTLVTNNEADFEGLPGLAVENWIAAG